MTPRALLVLLAALASAAAAAAAVPGATTVEILGETVDLADHVLAPDGEVTIIAHVADASAASAARGAGREVAASSSPRVVYINVDAREAGKVLTKLRRTAGVEAARLDTRVWKLGAGPGRRRRRLAQEEPFGIEMVLENVTWWQEKFAEGPPPDSAKVCVVDTGYGNGHPDLPPLTDDDGYVPPVDNPEEYGTWDVDKHGHGTHCAGSIGALDNAEGVVGVIPSSLHGQFSFFIAKGLSDSGSGSSAGVMLSVQACVDAGANVVSMSLGGDGGADIPDEYRHFYEEDDVLIVAAAGNSGNSALSYPASYQSVMSVAAVDSSEDKASFSQYNDQVEIAGPGVDVKSTVTDDSGSTFGYDTWSGTSMATPHVAAVAALLRMHFPACRAFQIRRALIVTAQDGGEPSCDPHYGHGIVRAKAAYEYLADQTRNACDPAEPFKEPLGGCAENSCLADEDCDDDGDPDSINQCVSHACVTKCATDAYCDDGSACTVNTCVNGECAAAYLPGVTEVKVELTTDRWPEDVAWTLKDGDGVVRLEGGDYSEPDARHVSAHCATEGHQATFEIADEWGDGTCCDWGDGRYLIKVNGEEVASGGDYGWGATETFSVPAPVIDHPAPENAVYFTLKEADCHRPILTSESCKQVAKRHRLPFKTKPNPNGSTKFPGGCFLWVRKLKSDENERTAAIAWNPENTAGTNCKHWKQCVCSV